MQNIVIQPRLLVGQVTPPASKSQAHRLLLCAGLAQGTTTIKGVTSSEDIQATLTCIQVLGATWRKLDAATIQVDGVGKECLANRGEGESLPSFPCGESGSTLRFLIPVALAVAGGGVFTGQGRLMQRPQTPYAQMCQDKDILFQQAGELLTVKGQLPAGKYTLSGDVSSQFLTGLLLALPLLEGDSQVSMTTPLESRDYVSMTLQVLGDFGVEITAQDGVFYVSGKQHYQPSSQTIEKDWSQAAFWYAANFLGSQVELVGMNPKSVQGDIRIAAHYWQLARPGDVELDVSQCPDLVPALAAMATVRKGCTRLVNAARLRLKESDRLASVTAALTALGANIEEGADTLTIYGVQHLQGGAVVDCCNDHRIAMMSAVVATQCKEPVTLLGADCVHKSYPDFWEHYRMLGGEFHVILPR